MTFKSLLVPTLLICNCLVSLSAFAAAPTLPPEHIVDVESDSSSFAGLCKLDVVRQTDGKIVEMIYTSAKGVVSLFPVALLQSQGEQPLLTSDTYGTVLFIDLEKDFDGYKGGHVIVRFMTNVILRSKKDFRILVQTGNEVTFRSDPNNSDKASDHNTYTGEFNHLLVSTKGAAGIKALIPSIR